VKQWFSMSRLPITLIVGGLAVNLIDIATTPAGTSAGGKLFGTAGLLKGVNSALPAIYVPGTKSDTFPKGVPLNLGGYMIAVGVIWWLIRKFA